MALYRIAGYLFESIFDTSFLKKKSLELLPGFSHYSLQSLNNRTVLFKQ